ncbi:MAG: recombination protein O N-terminal domain-containing protein [Candidatus Colwellbacteria bacterium]|nr:recombination protein O N-terminal domain-containing protein [Candidatus Colwellbacteria bacterium]
MMIEHDTWGVILDRTREDELDTEYSIFTWDLGKVRAKAISVRKPAARLAGHLEPGTLSRLRLVQRVTDGNFRIAESLMEEKTKDPRAIRAMIFADQMTALLQADISLFGFLKDLATGSFTGSEALSYRKILSIIGLDPSEAVCANCGSKEIAYFLPQDIMFLCHKCLSEKKQSIG